MIRQIWMRVGTRVLCSGVPGEIVFIRTKEIDGKDVVLCIDVRLYGHTEVDCFQPHEVQLDRIRREVSHVS